MKLLQTIIITFISLIVFGQNNEEETKQFLKDISNHKRVLLKENVVQWDSTDYFIIDELVHDKCFIQYFPEYPDTIILILEELLNKIPFNEKSVLWTKTYIPWRFKIVDSLKYKCKALKDVSPSRIQDLSGYNSISFPIFSNCCNYALLKLDFAERRGNSNTCIIRYLFYIKENSKWSFLLGTGKGCTSE